MDHNTGYIYTLVDPRTDSVRYVGASVEPDQRLQAHISNPHSDPLSEWIRDLKEDDLKPEINIVSEHDVEKLSDREEEVIQEYSEDTELLNGQSHSGYAGFFNSVSEQMSKQDLSDAEQERLVELLQVVQESIENKDPAAGYRAIGEMGDVLDMDDVQKNMPLYLRIGWAQKYLEDTISAINRAEGMEALDNAEAALELLQIESIDGADDG